MFADYFLLLLSANPRRYKVLVNLLNGRRTVSTLFWGRQYQLLNYYNAFHQMSIQAVEVTLRQLAADGLVKVDFSQGLVQLTPTGKLRQDSLKKQLYLPKHLMIGQRLNLYQVIPLVRLALQVISQASHSSNRYYPVSTDVTIQQSVKRWYHVNRRLPLATSTYQLLLDQIQQLDSTSAALIVADLTGYQHPGLTDQQLAAKFDLPVFTIQIRLLDAWAQIIQGLIEHQQPWTDLLSHTVRKSQLSTSCELTYQLFLQGTELEKIAQTRHIKANTVKEHLLEAAIFDTDFPFQRILPTTLQAKLATIFQGPVAEWQFQSVVDQQLSLDFFHFRLYQILRGSSN